MARRQRQETAGWLILGVALAILLYLMKRGNGLLHETVSSSIVTPFGTVTSDPITGAPQFDPNVAATIPANEDAAVAPICGPGAATFTPSDPRKCACPDGYQLWKNIGAMIYECIPR